jgi:outer membrane immunogenic protein
MRHLLLSTVAFAALAGSAFAADLPSRKEAPVYVAPVPVFSWTGFYIGADIGGGFGNTRITSDTFNWQSHGLDTSGVIGGGYVGYNYQFNQTFVLGIEGDFQGSSSSASFYNAFNDVTVKNQQNWLASINGRIGISYDRALFYAIGGGAWAQSNTTAAAGPVLAASLRGINLSVGRDKDLSGWDIGGGVEYAFTPNWLGRVEYRYYDFGTYNLTNVGTYLPLHLRNDVNTVRVGLAYLFSAPAPVVAKY